jgi:hypothetical protein
MLDIETKIVSKIENKSSAHYMNTRTTKTRSVMDKVFVIAKTKTQAEILMPKLQMLPSEWYYVNNSGQLRGRSQITIYLISGWRDSKTEEEVIKFQDQIKILASRGSYVIEMADMGAIWERQREEYRFRALNRLN